MKVFYSDHQPVILPAGHRFPMPKYYLLRQAIEESNLLPSEKFVASQIVSDDQILRVHTWDYLNRLMVGQMTEREMRRIGFPWSQDLVLRARLSAGGTLGACRAALDEKISVNLAGGTHHAHPTHGEGFCIFNDVAIAARAMQAEGRVAKVIVVDLDVHQGDGTADIFQEDPTVFTFSVHGEKNFPYRKFPSDLDIALPDGCTDEEYLEAVRNGLDWSLARFEADLVIYIAGADPYFGDRLGRLAVTKAGLASRDQLVLERCFQKGIPVAVVLGGGYADPIQETVAIHLQTVKLAIEKIPVVNSL